MNTQMMHPAKYPVASTAYDILMVSAFGLWSLLLGLSPVLVFHALS